jgi:protein SCO1
MSSSTALRTGLARFAVAATLLLVPALGVSALGGVRRTDTGAPPVLGRVADFALVDQASAPVSRAALDGEPWVASFVFTRCPLVCPRLSERMRAIQALAGRDTPGLRLVTFSVDPEHDVPEVLRSYADAHGADRNRWKFLTGSADSIAAVARSFAVALAGEADPGRSDFGIMHSGHLILVDGRGRIRGYYPSAEEGVESRILEDVKRLGVS